MLGPRDTTAYEWDVEGVTDCELTFIGTATCLLRLGPFTVLTDPNFLHRGERAYLGYGLSSKRLTEPAMTIDQLPELDAIVLSHLHGDHWDRRARHDLDKSVPVVTTRHAATYLIRRDKFRDTVGLRTWESHELEKDGQHLRVTSLPGAHSTNRFLRALLPPVMGSLLELSGPDGAVSARVYLTGDTMLVDGINEIARRHPDIDMAVVHLGGTTLPGGFVVTMTGAMGVELLQRVRPRAAVPIHYDDYGIFKSGLDDFRSALAGAQLPVDIREVLRGETVPLGSRQRRHF
jgi:L-ascorbate metabolism protein UlaG (beta-lactamase superfamily)